MLKSTSCFHTFVNLSNHGCLSHTRIHQHQAGSYATGAAWPSQARSNPDTHFEPSAPLGELPFHGSSRVLTGKQEPSWAAHRKAVPSPATSLLKTPGPGLPPPRRTLGPGESSVCSQKLLLPPPPMSEEERIGERSRDQTALSSAKTQDAEAGMYESLLKGWGNLQKKRVHTRGRVGKGKVEAKRVLPRIHRESVLTRGSHLVCLPSEKCLAPKLLTLPPLASPPTPKDSTSTPRESPHPQSTTVHRFLHYHQCISWTWATCTSQRSVLVLSPPGSIDGLRQGLGPQG